MVVIESNLLEIFGHGETVSAALDDLLRDLEYYSGYYARLNQSEVAGEGARLKWIYASLFA